MEKSVNINRLLINHARVTHSHLLSGDVPPEYTAWQCHLRVKHVLLECEQYSQTRGNYSTCTSMKKLESVDNETIADFIKNIDFYHCT